jgi:hypothetical protein
LTIVVGEVNYSQILDYPTFHLNTLDAMYMGTLYKIVAIFLKEGFESRNLRPQRFIRRLKRDQYCLQLGGL